MAFLYRRTCDDMLMVHVPGRHFFGTPDCEYYEFNDKNIIGYIAESDEFEKFQALFELDVLTHFPKHLGNFVRNYIEENGTRELVETISRDDFSVADEFIRRALVTYSNLSRKQRIKLHLKELDALRKQIRRESRNRLK